MISRPKKRLAVYLLNVVFSIYLLITVLITLTQMFSEYRRIQDHVKTALATTEAIFSESLTTAAWTFDTPQLSANLDGILKMPAIVGIKIDGMDKPPDWKKPFPIRLGTIMNDEQRVINMNQAQNQPYLQLIAHRFQLKKNDLLLGDVTLYSSNLVVFDFIKYSFLLIVIGAVVKTIVLWLLFMWAFNRFLGKKLAVFCQTMDNADIDNPETLFLTLQTDDIDELCRIEQAFNNLLKRVIDKKQALDELNATLEQKVVLRTEELEQLNSILTQLSITDSLTGLANRRHFDDVLIAECRRAARTNQPLALMMIDVDLFKKYNDHYGHQAGDDCLVTVATIFKTHAHRISDLAARYGGEEFAFIAPATDETNALHLSQEICNALASQQLPHELSSFGIVTVSIGVAVFVSTTPEHLIKKADEAMYCAKFQGRNQVVLSHD
jgi:diguanylate cyclase (GGDEF)-like protein